MAIPIEYTGGKPITIRTNRSSTGVAMIPKQLQQPGIQSLAAELNKYLEHESVNTLLAKEFPQLIIPPDFNRQNVLYKYLNRYRKQPVRALEELAATLGQDIDIARIILDNYIVTQEDLNILVTDAVRNGNYEMFTLLTNHDASPNLSILVTNSTMAMLQYYMDFGKARHLFGRLLASILKIRATDENKMIVKLDYLLHHPRGHKYLQHGLQLLELSQGGGKNFKMQQWILKQPDIHFNEEMFIINYDPTATAIKRNDIKLVELLLNDPRIPITSALIIAAQFAFSEPLLLLNNQRVIDDFFAAGGTQKILDKIRANELININYLPKNIRQRG
jgi:hypothetical protein